MVGIGLPNGTHEWQPADGTQKNGMFKCTWVGEKDRLVVFKTAMGMNAQVATHDIMPLVNLCWEKSFACKDTNLEAIRERGWNPLNKALLTKPEILATKKAAAKQNTNGTAAVGEDLGLVPVDTVTVGSNTLSDLSSLTEPPPKVFEVLDKVNFEHGISAEFATNLVQYLIRNHHVKKQFEDRVEEGKSLREKLGEVKKITAGQIFKAGSVALDSDVRDAVKDRINEKLQVELDKVGTAIVEYKERRIAYQRTINEVGEGVDPQLLSNKQLKNICFWRKRKGDDAMPSRKEELVHRFNDTKDRQELSLEDFLKSEKGLKDRIVSEYFARQNNQETKIASADSLPFAADDDDDSTSNSVATSNDVDVEEEAAVWL